MPKKKVIHYRDKCIGCGLCALLAPDDWEMSSEDGKANLKDSTENGGIYSKEINPENEKSNEEASAQCPVNIIKIS
ncbi:ferredoxin [Candidatus Dojkabacteria bacterium]|nr:ferredoxin [Candidatus Dojkabacteria bacterium]